MTARAREVNQNKVAYGSWWRADRDRRFMHERFRNNGGYVFQQYRARAGGYQIGTRDKLDLRRWKGARPIE